MIKIYVHKIKDEIVCVDYDPQDDLGLVTYSDCCILYYNNNFKKWLDDYEYVGDYEF